MKKIWVKKMKSFKEANEFNDEYYKRMTPIERLEIIQILREEYSKFSKKGMENGTSKGLRRVVRIIKQI